MVKKSKSFCCFGEGKEFPTFWFIVLLLSVVWFLGEIGWITFNFPWFPAIIIIAAIGAIINHYSRK